MHWTILAVGRIRPPYTDDFEHYARLLGRYAQLRTVEVRDDEQLMRRCSLDDYTIVLDADGRSYDSVAFSKFVRQRRELACNVTFVLGGAFGLKERLPRCDHKLSLGSMTLPHQLARVVLIEQLYRSHKILAGEPYHH